MSKLNEKVTLVNSILKVRIYFLNTYFVFVLTLYIQSDRRILFKYAEFRDNLKNQEEVTFTKYAFELITKYFFGIFQVNGNKIVATKS